MPCYDKNENTIYLNESWNLNKTKRHKIDRVRDKYHTDEDYKEHMRENSKLHYQHNKEKIREQNKIRYYWIKSFGDADYRRSDYWNLLRIGGDVFL